MEAFDDDRAQDEIQILLNDAKRAALEERYGARFIRAKDSRLPPEVEGMFLDHIAEFQERLEDARAIPLRIFANLPYIPRLPDLPGQAVQQALEDLLEKLAESDVRISFPDTMEAAEAYRFITEELLDEEVLDIRLPGMTLNFVFGEFRE